MNKDLFQSFMDSLNMEEEEDYLLYERLERFKKEKREGWKK